MLFTIILAIIFTLLQMYEYITSPICISDGVYGSTFFVMTGFHGLHVIIGTVFLITCLCRIILDHFFYKSSVGLECAIWYWHFVDVVWLFLFVSLYVWGNDISYIHGKRHFFVFKTDEVSADYALKYQLGFQDPATLAMEGIIDLHHNIMAFLIFIFIVVCFMMYHCVKDVGVFYKSEIKSLRIDQHKFIFSLLDHQQVYFLEVEDDEKDGPLTVRKYVDELIWCDRNN